MLAARLGMPALADWASTPANSPTLGVSGQVTSLLPQIGLLVSMRTSAVCSPEAKIQSARNMITSFLLPPSHRYTRPSGGRSYLDRDQCDQGDAMSHPRRKRAGED